MLSSGPSQVSATRSQPGALGSESGGGQKKSHTHTPAGNFSSGRWRSQGWPRGGCGPRRGLPGGSRVLGFRRRRRDSGGAGRGRWGCRPQLCTLSREVGAPRPSALRGAEPGPTRQRKGGPRAAAPHRARPAGERGRARGRGPGRRALTSVLQPVAELAALADAQLPLLLGLRRLARRGAQRAGGGGRGRVAPGRRRDCGTRGAAALAARGRLHGARRRVRAATTSAAGTRVRSARRRGWERAEGRTDRAGAAEWRCGGGRGRGGCAGAARLAWPVAETRAQQQLPRSAPGGRCVRQGPAPRPRRRSPRPEAGGEGGIRPGLKPGGSGVWAGLPGKPGRNPGRAC